MNRLIKVPTQQLRVLIIEDSECDAQLLLTELREQGYDVLYRRVADAETLKVTLSSQQWDLVVSDQLLPQFSGTAALAICQQFDRNLPFILLSGAIRQQTAAQAMRTGAEDYLIKGDTQRLIPAVERALRAAQTRKQHQQALIALEESEARFRAIASNTPGMVYQLLFKTDGTVLFPYVSEGCYNLLGIHANALQKNPALFMDLILPDDRISYNRSMAASASKLVFWNWEGRVRVGEKHEIKWINLRSSPRRVSGGIQWEGIISNITQSKFAEIEIKQTQSALKESEARFRAIVSNTPGMVYQFLLKNDASVSFPYVSEGCYHLLRIPPKALQDHPALFIDLIHSEDRSAYSQSMATSAEKLSFWNWEGRVSVGETQEIKWVNLRSSPRKTTEGIQWEGIISNITQSKLAELEIKQSREQIRELTSHLQTIKEHERASISREIHDDIGGTLAAAKIDLLALTNNLPSAQPCLFEKARSVERLLDRAIETTSRISRDLRPGILDFFGICAAIEWQAEEFQTRTGTRCGIIFEDDNLTLDPDLSIVVFRIFQETLTNIAKHAKATRVDAHLYATNTCVVLEVVDNGSGIMERDRAKPRSFGIRGMQERARYLGGDVVISGGPGKGTSVTVTIPVSQKSPSVDTSLLQQSLF